MNIHKQTVCTFIIGLDFVEVSAIVELDVTCLFQDGDYDLQHENNPTPWNKFAVFVQILFT